jgi:hypothetical protein
MTCTASDTHPRSRRTPLRRADRSAAPSHLPMYAPPAYFKLLPTRLPTAPHPARDSRPPPRPYRRAVPLLRPKAASRPVSVRPHVPPLFTYRRLRPTCGAVHSGASSDRPSPSLAFRDAHIKSQPMPPPPLHPPALAARRRAHTSRVNRHHNRLPTDLDERPPTSPAQSNRRVVAAAQSTSRPHTNHSPAPLHNNAPSGHQEKNCGATPGHAAPFRPSPWPPPPPAPERRTRPCLRPLQPPHRSHTWRPALFGDLRAPGLTAMIPPHQEPSVTILAHRTPPPTAERQPPRARSSGPPREPSLLQSGAPR